MAGLAPVVRLRHDRRPADGHHPAQSLPEALAEQRLAAEERHRRHEDAVRQLLQPLRDPADADEAFDPFVIGFQVGVRDAPVLAVPIAVRATEIDIAHAVGLASPGKRAPAQHAHPNPVKGLVLRGLIRILGVVDEPLVIRLAARVDEPLDRAVAHQFRRLRDAADVATRIPPVLQVVGHDVLGEVGVGDLGAGLEHADLQARGGQLPGSHAACGSGTHNDRIVDVPVADDRLQHAA